MLDVSEQLMTQHCEMKRSSLKYLNTLIMLVYMREMVSEWVYMQYILTITDIVLMLCFLLISEREQPSSPAVSGCRGSC